MFFAGVPAPRRNRNRHPPPTRRRQATFAIPPGRGVRCLILRLMSPEVRSSKKLSAFWIYKKPQLPARIWRYVFGKHVFRQRRGKAHSCGKRAFLWKVRIPVSGSATAPLIALPVGLVSRLRRLRRSSSVPIYIICPPCSFSVLRTHSSLSSPTSGTSYCCRGAPGTISCALREIPRNASARLYSLFAEILPANERQTG